MSKKIEITKGIEIDVIINEKYICFVCPQVGLDASYEIETGNITGKGSKTCNKLINEEVNKILNEEKNNHKLV